jgi:hypothetical protein
MQLESTMIKRVFGKTDGSTTDNLTDADYALVSFWAKMDDVGYFSVILNNQTIGAANTTAANTANEELSGSKSGNVRNMGWTYFEGIIKNNGAGSLFSFQIHANGTRAEAIWIDDNR